MRFWQIGIKYYCKHMIKTQHVLIKKKPTAKKLKPVYINPPKIESEENIAKSCLQEGIIMA